MPALGKDIFIEDLLSRSVIVSASCCCCVRRDVCRAAITPKQCLCHALVRGSSRLVMRNERVFARRACEVHVTVFALGANAGRE